MRYEKGQTLAEVGQALSGWRGRSVPFESVRRLVKEGRQMIRAALVEGVNLRHQYAWRFRPTTNVWLKMGKKSWSTDTRE